MLRTVVQQLYFSPMYIHVLSGACGVGCVNLNGAFIVPAMLASQGAYDYNLYCSVHEWICSLFSVYDIHE